MEFTLYTWRLPKPLLRELEQVALRDQQAIPDLLEGFTRAGLAEWEKKRCERLAEDRRLHIEALIAAGFKLAKVRKPKGKPKGKAKAT